MQRYAEDHDMTERAPAIDPDLLRDLDRAGMDQEVEAVFSLWPSAGDAAHPGSRRQAEIEQLLDRVRQPEPEGLHQYQVFPDLAAFSVRATGSFVRRLTQQPEVATATSNRQRTDFLIRPVASRPADAEPAGDEPAGGESTGDG
jgi:hypothetical protein